MQAALQDVMQRKAGIVRDRSGLEQALAELGRLGERARHVGIAGSREYNPGWHTALDLRSLLAVAEMTARAALERTESRGGHTRADHPESDPQQERRQVVVRRDGDRMTVRWEAQPDLPADLARLIKEGA